MTKTRNLLSLAKKINKNKAERVDFPIPVRNLLLVVLLALAGIRIGMEIL